MVVHLSHLERTVNVLCKKLKDLKETINAEKALVEKYPPALPATVPDNKTVLDTLRTSAELKFHIERLRETTHTSMNDWQLCAVGRNESASMDTKGYSFNNDHKPKFEPATDSHFTHNDAENILNRVNEILGTYSPLDYGAHHLAWYQPLLEGTQDDDTDQSYTLKEILIVKNKFGVELSLPNLLLFAPSSEDIMFGQWKVNPGETFWHIATTLKKVYGGNDRCNLEYIDTRNSLASNSIDNLTTERLIDILLLLYRKQRSDPTLGFGDLLSNYSLNYVGQISDSINTNGLIDQTFDYTRILLYLVPSYLYNAKHDNDYILTGPMRRSEWIATLSDPTIEFTQCDNIMRIPSKNQVSSTN